MVTATMLPEMWKWRMASDETYYGYDAKHSSFMPYQENVANLGLGWGLYFMMVHFYAWEWLAIVLVIMLQFVWQCKNALVPYYNFNLNAAGTILDGTWTARYFGGMGYSWKAEIYGAGGVFLAFLLDVMWPPALQPMRDEEEANSF